MIMNNPICSGTIFETTFDKYPSLAIALRLRDFIPRLQAWHGRALQTKETNQLICPSLFKGTRCVANATKANGIWLDNDTGALSHNQLAVMFPNLRMVVFNSFRTTFDVTKYRVFIPTTQPMESGVYAGIWGELIRQVQLINPEHGFDLGPRHCAAMFYLPCQAQVREASFFVDYDNDGREPLNTLEWMRSAARNSPPDPPTHVRGNSNPPDVARIEEALARIPAGSNRDIWFPVLCALYHEYGDMGMAIARAWSLTGRDKYDERDFNRQWNSIKRGQPRKPVTAGTIFWLAKQF
jgi:hypothetical protein